MFPRPTCSPTNAAQMCDERRIACRSGEMRCEQHGMTWRWPVDILFFAFWPRLPRYSWTFCPFCGADLPSPAKMRAILHGAPQPFSENPSPPQADGASEKGDG